MRYVLLLAACAALSGCAEMAQGTKVFADGVNHGVARAPDATVDVNVNQR